MHVMGWQGKRAALASVLAALALALAACGGDDSSNDSGSSADAGRTVTTGASGVTGVTDVDGTTGATGSAPTGGSKAPSSPKKGTTTRDTSPKGSDKSSDNRVPKKDTKFDPDKPSAGELANLYTQARQVCKVLTLQGLAHEYEVAETPSAVAKAYSKAYPAAQRAAVYNGCKSGVS
jgi:hypothetical protein